ncbi:MAG TPA: hypothetical protein VHL11_12865 [Phototrophicaceae bacterium]|jgi:hypothetical protein|nr:hypothetical protein [Phototrophicaceae bacterium]
MDTLPPSPDQPDVKPLAPMLVIWEYFSDPGAIVRNTVMVISLMFAGMVVWLITSGYVGKSFTANDLKGVALLFMIGMGAVGFAISGGLAGAKRWQQLIQTAALTLIAIAGVQILVLGLPPVGIVSDLLVILVMLGVGGAGSYIFNRRQVAGAKPIPDEAEASVKRFRPVFVIRDVFLMIVLFIIAVALSSSSSKVSTPTFSAGYSVTPTLLVLIGVGVGGFAMSGGLAGKKRWWHLTVVGVVIWGLLCTLGASAEVFFPNAVMVLFWMGVGGAISYIFNH